MKLNDLNLTNTAVAIRRKDDNAPSIMKKLSDTYTEFAKIVFMFDCSSSMNNRLTVNYIDQYQWTDAILAEIRLKATQVLSDINLAIAADPALAIGWQLFLNEQDAETAQIFDEAKTPDGGPLFTADDEEIKTRVLRHDLMNHFGVQIDWSKHKQTVPTRMDVVKRLAKVECEKRFKQFPNSKVALVRFASGAELAFNDGEESKLYPEIDRMYPAGGTDLGAALRAGIEACRNRPSDVGIHHFIIVSDGETWCSMDEWVPVLKASGVVLDYIHIGDRSPNEAIVAACKTLGGDCVTVTTEKDLEAKFVEVVKRPLLPPASV